MSPYQSSTKQIQSPYAWTFVDLNVDETGACWTAERNALRDIKPKGLVVRYPNGIELLCTDGKTWRSVPRVHHDKSKA